MEQILIRNLPGGTKANLRARASRHHRTAEAEARAILTAALATDPPSIVDLLRSDETADVDFEPARLGLTVRPVEW